MGDQEVREHVLASIGSLSAGGDPALHRPVLGVEAAYLHAAFDETHSRFGSIEACVTEGLGIDADESSPCTPSSSSNHAEIIPAG